MKKLVKPKRKPVSAEDPSQLIGATVVGERGQIVIPKDIRERLGLVPGTKIMVMQHGDSPVMLLPIEKMQEMIRQMSERVARALAPEKPPKKRA